MSEAQNINVLSNGAKLVGESLLPGASLMMDGKVVNGAAHAVVGLGAKALLGPVGLALVAADSFSKSLTDKYIWDHVSEIYSDQKERRAAKREASAATEQPADAEASDASTADAQEQSDTTTTTSKSTAKRPIQTAKPLMAD